MSDISSTTTVSPITIRVSTRGRITIPAAIRNSLGLEGGEKYRWEARDDGSLELIFERPEIS